MLLGDDESIDGELLKGAYIVTLTSFDTYTFSLREPPMSFSQTQCLSYGHFDECETSLSFFKGTWKRGSSESVSFGA
ncbi:hypothetical protein IGI04_025667 [Brassica rapa subsp. trilocularis]|uniref:Uncharacterized protein n=1 Tax=Brassica rapa subsp. trilocularis TaxID=1813537 RepID=A0ABQ7KWG9_BRACM|nr:hypothetical protein IGI04_025667 [Brassica rapa subsp. trilocularis]